MTWLFRQKFFRNFLFRLLRKDRLPIVSRQMEDHLILFSPSGVIGRRLMVHGDWYREHVYSAISLLVKHGFSFDNKVALDIGANIGTQTIYMHLHGLFSKIIAVEPESNNFFLLKANVEVNDLMGKTTLINAPWQRNRARSLYMLMKGSQMEEVLFFPESRSLHRSM